MGQIIKLTDGCLSGSMTHKSRINEVIRERPEDFIFYTDPMGDWKFSELVDSFVEDFGLEREAVREYIFDNLKSLCSYDVPSMYQVIRRQLVGPYPDEEEFEELIKVEEELDL